MRYFNLAILFCIFHISAQAEYLIRGVYFKAPKGAVRSVYIYDGKENHLMDIPSVALSKPIELPANVRSFIISPQPVREENKTPTGSFQVNLKEGWKDVVLLFSTDSKKPHFPIKATTMNVSSNVIKPGEIYWLNLSKNNVRVKLGDKKIILKPNSRKVSEPPTTQNKQSYPILIDCKLPEHDQAAPLISTYWRHNKLYKQIVFILPRPDSKYPSINSLGFRDVKKPQTEKAVQ